MFESVKDIRRASEELEKILRASSDACDDCVNLFKQLGVITKNIEMLEKDLEKIIFEGIYNKIW